MDNRQRQLELQRKREREREREAVDVCSHGVCNQPAIAAFIPPYFMLQRKILRKLKHHNLKCSVSWSGRSEERVHPIRSNPLVRELGRRLIDHSTVLIARWRGVDNESTLDDIAVPCRGTLKMQDWKMRHQEKYGTLQVY